MNYGGVGRAAPVCTLCQKCASLALMVWDLWFSKDFEEKIDSMNQSVYE